VSVFNPFDEWHITAPERSKLLGEVAVVFAPWIMPLFMLLAGVSAWFSLARRTNAAYVRERVMRVLIPLLVGILVLVPPQVYLERVWRGQFQGSFWRFYPHFFQGIYPTGNLSWHHLWFLAHLFAYALVALPLLRYWQRNPRAPTLRWISRACASRKGILWLALPLIVERNLLWGVFRERHMFTSDWSNHAILFVAFVYGFLMAGTPAIGRAIDRQWTFALLLGACASSALVVATWTEMLPERAPAPYGWLYVAFWSTYGVCAWGWMVGVLGAARRWLRRDSTELQHGRRRAYGWYLFHQPVILGVAFWVIRWRVGLVEQAIALFGISAVGTWFLGELWRLVAGIWRGLTRHRPVRAHGYA
jgi:glucans biosynthesis protein C